MKNNEASLHTEETKNGNTDNQKSETALLNPDIYHKLQFHGLALFRLSPNQYITLGFYSGMVNVTSY
jgi:hypothetical protein